MTIREIQALLILYHACHNFIARRRALELVPGLDELVTLDKPTEKRDDVADNRTGEDQDNDGFVPPKC